MQLCFSLPLLDIFSGNTTSLAVVCHPFMPPKHLSWNPLTSTLSPLETQQHFVIPSVSTGPVLRGSTARTASTFHVGLLFRTPARGMFKNNIMDRSSSGQSFCCTNVCVWGRMRERAWKKWMLHHLVWLRHLESLLTMEMILRAFSKRLQLLPSLLGRSPS